MSVVTDILSKGLDISDVLKEVREFSDQHHTSREEKNEHELKMLQEALAYKKFELQTKTASHATDGDNVTKRWTADYASDNWLSKNVRPGVLAGLTVFLLVITILDAALSTFNVTESWILFWKAVYMVVIGAYFLGRSGEKAVDDWVGHKKDSPTVYLPPSGETVKSEVQAITQRIQSIKKKQASYIPPSSIEHLK